MALGVDRLAEGECAIGRLGPGGELEAAADEPAPLEEVDEVVEPLDEEPAGVAGAAGELIASAFFHCLDLAHQVEEGEPCLGEELGPVTAADVEADVGLVLERLPAGQLST